jgi:hypothetical protein
MHFHLSPFFVDIYFHITRKSIDSWYRIIQLSISWWLTLTTRKLEKNWLKNIYWALKKNLCPQLLFQWNSWLKNIISNMLIMDLCEYSHQKIRFYNFCFCSELHQQHYFYRIAGEICQHNSQFYWYFYKNVTFVLRFFVGIIPNKHLGL